MHVRLPQGCSIKGVCLQFQESLVAKLCLSFDSYQIMKIVIYLWDLLKLYVKYHKVFWNIGRSSVKVMIIHTCMIQNRHLFTTPILLLAEAEDFRIIFSQQTTINSGEDVGYTYYNTVCISQFMKSDRVSISRWTDPQTMVYAHSGTFTLKEWSTHSGASTLIEWSTHSGTSTLKKWSTHSGASTLKERSAHSGASTLRERSAHSGAFTLIGWNYATCWRSMQLEITTVYRLSQTQEDKCHMCSLIYRS